MIELLYVWLKIRIQKTTLGFEIKKVKKVKIKKVKKGRSEQPLPAALGPDITSSNQHPAASQPWGAERVHVSQRSQSPVSLVYPHTGQSNGHPS